MGASGESSSATASGEITLIARACSRSLAITANGLSRRGLRCAQSSHRRAVPRVNHQVKPTQSLDGDDQPGAQRRGRAADGRGVTVQMSTVQMSVRAASGADRTR